MLMSVKTLKPIAPQPGRPLYITARDAVREAIDTGIFTPGEQMPSTKELSSQLSVSLVTAHRALQELVTTGVLSRCSSARVVTTPTWGSRALKLSRQFSRTRSKEAQRAISGPRPAARW